MTKDTSMPEASSSMRRLARRQRESYIYDSDIAVNVAVLKSNYTTHPTNPDIPSTYLGVPSSKRHEKTDEEEVNISPNLFQLYLLCTSCYSLMLISGSASELQDIIEEPNIPVSSMAVTTCRSCIADIHESDSQYLEVAHVEKCLDNFNKSLMHPHMVYCSAAYNIVSYISSKYVTVLTNNNNLVYIKLTNILKQSKNHDNIMFIDMENVKLVPYGFNGMI